MKAFEQASRGRANAPTRARAGHGSGGVGPQRPGQGGHAEEGKGSKPRGPACWAPRAPSATGAHVDGARHAQGMPTRWAREGNHAPRSRSPLPIVPHGDTFPDDRPFPCPCPCHARPEAPPPQASCAPPTAGNMSDDGNDGYNPRARHGRVGGSGPTVPPHGGTSGRGPARGKGRAPQAPAMPTHAPAKSFWAASCVPQHQAAQPPAA
jgi:hypothetical protein